MRAEFVEVGVVKVLYRYPVKSMRGEALAEARVYWHGLDGDRRYAFVRGDNDSGFPWLTGRETPQLVRYAPYFTDPGDVVNSPVYVETLDGRTLPLESAELRAEVAEAYGGDVHLMHIGRGIVRCVMVNIDPETAASDPRVLKTVAQSRDSCAGVYGSTEKPGTIRVGDVVRVMRDA